MELNPEAPLRKQLQSASSTRLERLVAGTCASVGYTVFRDLQLDEQGTTIGQTDILASTFLPLREQRILIECKGGLPKPREIREFSTWRHLFDPSPDELVLIARGDISDALRKVAERLGVSLVRSRNLRNYLVPLLNVPGLRETRAKNVNPYFKWQRLHDFFIATATKNDILQPHYRFLTFDLWKIPDAAAQMEASYDKYTNLFKTTSEQVAQSQGTTTAACLHSAANDAVEASFYVMWLHRMMNVYSVVRTTLHIMRHKDTEHLVNNMGGSIRQAVSLLSEKPCYLHGFPSFLQTFLFVWGGFVTRSRREEEVNRLAAEIYSTPDAVEHYLQATDLIFSGDGTGLKQDIRNVEAFVYVPGAIRGLGIHHRRESSDAYDNFKFFGNYDAAYLTALDRTLAQT